MAKRQTKKAPPKHSAAFVERALATWEKGRAEGKTSDEAAKGLGVTSGMLYYWQARRDGKKWGNITGKAPPPAERPRAMVVRSERVEPDRTRALRKDSAAAEVIRLRQEIAMLREECNLLTEVVAVFARRRV